MGRKRAKESDVGKLEGLKYFALLDDLFERL